MHPSQKQIDTRDGDDPAAMGSCDLCDGNVMWRQVFTCTERTWWLHSFQWLLMINSGSFVNGVDFDARSNPRSRFSAARFARPRAYYWNRSSQQMWALPTRPSSSDNRILIFRKRLPLARVRVRFKRRPTLRACRKHLKCRTYQRKTLKKRENWKIRLHPAKCLISDEKQEKSKVWKGTFVEETGDQIYWRPWSSRASS